MTRILLDVNALIAWEHPGSPHHARFHAWAAVKQPRDFRTCALTELGFLRVSMQVFGYSLHEAQTALGEIKAHCGGYLMEAPSPLLPGWASTAGRTTDAYLVQLAKTHHSALATFDEGITDVAVLCIS